MYIVSIIGVLYILQFLLHDQKVPSMTAPLRVESPPYLQMAPLWSVTLNDRRTLTLGEFSSVSVIAASLKAGNVEISSYLVNKY